MLRRRKNGKNEQQIYSILRLRSPVTKPTPTLPEHTEVVKANLLLIKTSLKIFLYLLVNNT